MTTRQQRTLGRQRRRGGSDKEKAEDVCAVLVILHICPTFGNYLYNPHFTPPFFTVTLLSMVTPLEQYYA